MEHQTADSTPGTPITGVANIAVEGSGPLGPLSYLVPEQLTVHAGDEVHVPYGKQTRFGVALGAGDATKATRELLAVTGRRATGADLDAAAAVARKHFTDLGAVAGRFAPKRPKKATEVEPATAGTVSTVELPPFQMIPAPAETSRGRLLVRAPLVDPADLAAAEAARLAAFGQVLILCPTSDLVAAVAARFTDGAARLDGKHGYAAYLGLQGGTVQVGIGTRAAALYSPANLAGIVLVEEDHPGHNEITQPRWHARDVALARALAHRCHLTVISAQPTTVALASRLHVIEVGGPTGWPTMRLIGRSSFDPGQRQLPPPLRAILRDAANAGMRPIVLAARKQANRICVRCSALLACPVCDDSTCTHPQTEPCGTCEAVAGARMVGWDAARLAHLFRDRATPVSFAELITARDAGVVVLYDVDAALRAPGMTPETYAAQVILAAARAAGPGGTVVALTDDPAQNLLQDLFVRRDQLAVARRAWRNAAELRLPPFGHVVTVHSGHRDAPNTSGWPGDVLGPRREGKEWQAIVRLAADDMPKMAHLVTTLRRRGKVRVDVD